MKFSKHFVFPHAYRVDPAPHHSPSLVADVHPHDGGVHHQECIVPRTLQPGRLPKEMSIHFSICLHNPTDQEYVMVQYFLSSYELTTLCTYDDKGRIDAVGTVEQIERAFRTRLIEYRLNGVMFFAPSSDLVLPADIEEVVEAVVGLDNLAQMRTLLVNQRVVEPSAYTRSSNTTQTHPPITP